MEATVSTNSNDSERVAEPQELKASKADIWWPIAAAAVIGLTALIRLYRLEIVPLHHDEGVNGYFLTRLFHEGFYRYDPANYHGPTLYYLALPFVSILGLNTFAIRCVTVVFGIGIVWLVLELRRDLGRTAALSAAMLISISPGAVYFSRYFIHETLFVFLTLAILLASLRYWQTRSRLSLFAGASCVALLAATKETAVITLGIFLIALAATWFWMRFVRRAAASTDMAGTYTADEPIVYEGSEPVGICFDAVSDDLTRSATSRASDAGEISEPLAPAHQGIGAWVGAIALACVLFVLFYSSFFTGGWHEGIKGVTNGLTSLGFWTKTGESQHAHPWNQYLKWIWQMESPLVVLAAVGGVISIWKRDGLRFFILLWTIGILTAYSIIPYKTPWLALNFIPPLALLAGIALEASVRASRLALPLVVLILAVALVTSGYRSIQLNFYRYDDDRYAYVYAHTRREFLNLVSEVYDLANRSGQGTETSIAVLTENYWPLPWYLRDYTHVAYYGKLNPTDADLVIAPPFQDDELRSILANHYRSVGVYTLRPGVDLALYERDQLPESK